jgi:hypothetical protein
MSSDLIPRSSFRAHASRARSDKRYALARGMTAEKKFSFSFNLIWVVQPLLQKYSGSLLTQITSISFAIPAHTEGRFAIVTDVGQGMRWTRAARSAKILRGRTALTRTVKSCGPDAPTLASSVAEVTARRRWQESPVTGESSEETVKTIACGNAG